MLPAPDEATVPVPATGGNDRGHSDDGNVSGLPASHAGRFLPGEAWRGNRNGRPKGIKNRVTLRRLLLEDKLRRKLGVSAEQVLERAVNIAMNGDPDSPTTAAMLKILLDKMIASPKNDDAGDADKNSRVEIRITNLTQHGSPNTQVAALDSKSRVKVVNATATPAGD